MGSKLECLRCIVCNLTACHVNIYFDSADYIPLSLMFHRFSSDTPVQVDLTTSRHETPVRPIVSSVGVGLIFFYQSVIILK
jgi:aromatic ring-cleaving dioxygenase